MSDSLTPLLAARYSTRTFQDRPVPADTLKRLFDAARWAPSCFNEQPWRFVIAAKDLHPEAYARLASTLSLPGNAWALEAPVLGIAIANLSFARNGKPNRWAQYDTGQAMAHLTVQAQAESLNVHQMGGFDPAKATELLQIPAGYEAVAAFAIGYPADPNPPATRSRRDLSATVFAGTFGETF
jgi:nitroreductase